MALVTTNTNASSYRKENNVVSAMASFAASLIRAIKRDTHPHYYSQEKAERLERARQDVNRIWMHGRY